MSSNTHRTVLEVQHLGKSYPSYRSNLDRFARWFGLPAKPVSVFHALRDVSFAVRKGEAVAVIGQNGAGKSTLLKLITGTVRPTKGRMYIDGRIGAILELGIGFNPEFTGRQNIWMTGGLMGLDGATVERVMPEIEAFTELGDFFDRPVRLYSSGMQARLAFGLATAVPPSILIVDEVLSVGDAYFQHKSFERIRRFKDHGTSILFVSHSMADVRALCDRAILLDKGEVLKDGPPDVVTDYYNALIAEKENAKLTIEQRRSQGGWSITRSGTFDATIESLEMVDANTEEPIAVAHVGQRLRLRLVARFTRAVPQIVLGVLLRDRTGHNVWGSNTGHTGQIAQQIAAGESVEFFVDYVCDLGPGSYSWTTSLSSTDTHMVDNYEWTDNALVFDVVNADRPFFIGTSALAATFQVRKNSPAERASSVASSPFRIHES
jgi:lipopolysaccharide transport system ATP-binding protein